MLATDRQQAAFGYFAPGSIVHVAEALRTRRLSHAAAIEACLKRGASSEAAIAAFLDWRGDEALAEARRLDEGKVGAARPLDGIPFAVKDIIDVAGTVTTAASQVTDRVPASQDADIVRALSELGAVFIGKANTHEFAYGATTPPTRNPRDIDRIAGGSSGGSAAAVAAGSALLAVGSDTGGSIRLPAALCGVAAWRPLASQAIGTAGILPLAPEFDQWGLIAATAADLEYVWRALRHGAKPENAAIEFIVPSDLAATLPAVSAEVASTFAREVERLETDGARIVRADVPNFAAWSKPRMAVQMRAVLDVHRARQWWPQRRDRYGAEARRNMETAEAREAEDLAPYRDEQRMLDAAIDSLLDGGRVLLTPTTPVTAPLASDLETMLQAPGERHPIVGLLGQATLPLSRNSLTTLTAPARDGPRMPVGLQLAARGEGLLFKAARLLERGVA